MLTSVLGIDKYSAKYLQEAEKKRIGNWTPGNAELGIYMKTVKQLN